MIGVCLTRMQIKGAKKMKSLETVKENTLYSDIVKRVENETGYKLALHEISETFMYSLRKCKLNGKGVDYLPIMFESELRDYIAGVSITALGMINMITKNSRKGETICVTNAE